METYLVGGAVRDELLERPVKERDWVVVGATLEEMLAQGFLPVGKDFPVFLHPITKEEYALARTERKTGRGYKGFQIDANAAVTLEEDLHRRDLTMNAIAKTAGGRLIDPYGGVKDIHQKILRHVSDAFVEDPVRLLRVARFAAQLPDFHVALETLELLKAMVNNGEISHLMPERVWKELEKVLSAKAPQRFFEVIASCDALTILFPEFQQWHVVMNSSDPLSRFALLCSGLEKEKILALAERLRIPNEYADFAILLASYQEACLSAASAEEYLSLFMGADAFRRPQRFYKMVELVLRDDEQSVQRYRSALQCLMALDFSSLAKEVQNKAELPQQIYRMRLAALVKCLHSP